MNSQEMENGFRNSNFSKIVGSQLFLLLPASARETSTLPMSFGGAGIASRYSPPERRRGAPASGSSSGGGSADMDGRRGIGRSPLSGSTSPGAGLGALDTDMDPADAMIHIARGVRHERERERVCVCARERVRGREWEGERGRELGKGWHLQSEGGDRATGGGQHPTQSPAGNGVFSSPALYRL